jgi:hypothetical protein
MFCRLYDGVLNGSKSFQHFLYGTDDEREGGAQVVADVGEEAQFQLVHLGLLLLLQLQLTQLQLVGMVIAVIAYDAVDDSCQQQGVQAGGAYVTVTGQLKKVDTYEQLMVMENGTAIPIGNIMDLQF